MTGSRGHEELPQVRAPCSAVTSSLPSGLERDRVDGAFGRNAIRARFGSRRRPPRGRPLTSRPRGSSPSGLNAARSVPVSHVDRADAARAAPASKNSTVGPASPIASVLPSGEIAIHCVSPPAGDGPPGAIDPVGDRRRAFQRREQCAPRLRRIVDVHGLPRHQQRQLRIGFETRAGGQASGVRDRQGVGRSISLGECQIADHERRDEQHRDADEEPAQPAVRPTLPERPRPPMRRGSPGGTPVRGRSDPPHGALPTPTPP